MSQNRMLQLDRKIVLLASAMAMRTNSARRARLPHRTGFLAADRSGAHN